MKNREVLNRCMEAVKERLGFKIYVLLGEEVEGYWNVAASFREAVTKGIYLDEIAEGKEKIDGPPHHWPAGWQNMCWPIIQRISPLKRWAVISKEIQLISGRSSGEIRGNPFLNI